MSDSADISAPEPEPSKRRQGGKGRPFPKGVSGNPTGKPKQVRELLEVARRSVPDAFALAEKLMNGAAVEPRVRLEAAKFLTSYGLGAPPKEPLPDQVTTLTDDELLAEIDRRASARPGGSDSGAPTN